MTINDYKSEFFDALSSAYPKEEIQSFFTLTMAHYLQLSRTDMALEPQFPIPKAMEEILQSVLQELKQLKPIQYIIGTCEFYGLTFEVNTATLIPRPETEELVAWILESTSKNRPLRILDVGTGSGCIAISLAHALPEAQVFALDISEEALETAQRNATNNQTEVSFIHGDLMQACKLPENLDLLVSNPPYVTLKEKAMMRPNVLEYEPQQALFVPDDDPLLFYRALASRGQELLRPDGNIFVEINQNKGIETCQLFEYKGFRAVLKKDMFGVDRMIHAVREQHP